jgi:MFS family permease
MASGKRDPIFFGWWVVAASLVGLSFGSYSTFIGVSFGLFFKPLEASFGWSRSEISFAFLICNASIVLLAPVLGGLIDRFGVRQILLTATALFGLTVCSMSLLTSSLWHFYLMYLIIPLFGVGTLPSTYTRVILNWFDRQRGLALGIALSGFGVAAVIAPPLIQQLIATVGWRQTYLVMGVVVLVIAWPTIYLLFREHPNEMGLYPDGMAGGSQTLAIHASGYTLDKELKQRAFWMIATGFVLMGIAGTGFLAHFVATLTDRGFSPAISAWIFSLFGITIIIGRIGCGYLVDRFFAPYVGTVFLIGAAIGLAILALSDGILPAILAAILLGLGLGAEFDLLSFFISRYLGLKNYGKIYGFIYAAFQVGSGIGVMLMGVSFDHRGSYTIGLWLLSACMLTAAGIVFRLGPYRFGATDRDSHAVA